MTISKINNHGDASARFVYDENNNLRGLISYRTTVITIDENGWLRVSGLYSRTTIKHIGWFMRELGMTYQDAKSFYENNYKYNLYTGEVAAE